MSSVAVFGAGPIGSAIVQRLAERSRVNQAILIDDNASIAAGKALDLSQAGPIDRSSTRLWASGDPLAAVGADVVVLADDTAGGVWDGDRGLRLVERLVRAGATAPFVFAAPSQLALMETVRRELHVGGDRLVGTAAAAIEPAVASLVTVEAGETGASVSVTGRPPAFVVAWTAATIGGSLVSERVPPHRLLAISQSLTRLWPPGPQAIAAPTARVVEALIAGSRRLLPVVTIFDGELGVRERAGLVPAELGRGRVVRRVPPSLSPQERTETITSLMRQSR